MTIQNLLNEHNELAKKHGKLTLSSWKQSKDKLIGRINALKELDASTTKRIPANKPNESAKPRSNPTADKLIEKEAKRKEEADNMLTIVQVAAELNINPKVARAKLRRKKFHSNEGRWPAVKRDSREHKELIEVLTGKAS